MTTMAMAPAMRTSTGRAAGTAARTTPVARRAASEAVRPVVESRQNVGGLRLTGRGRLVLWLVAIVMIVGAVLVTSRAAADGPQSAQQVERHVVQPGETMWQIAADVAAPGQDVRDVVFDLVRLNELPDAGLMAGQVIVVPRD